MSYTVAPELSDTQVRVMLAQVMNDTEAVVQMLYREIDRWRGQDALLRYYVQSRLRFIQFTAGTDHDSDLILYSRGNELRQLLSSLDMELPAGVPTDDQERTRLHQEDR